MTDDCIGKRLPPTTQAQNSIYDYLSHSKYPFLNASSNDSEARVGGSLQTEVANKEKDRCDGNEQTGTSSNIERPSIISLDYTIALRKIRMVLSQMTRLTDA